MSQDEKPDPRTLKALVKEYGAIRIPRIQRDYAQGRPEEARVRDDFLFALRGAFDKSPKEPPLNLDFIYGTRTADRFHPVDGQQRLTTLFLIHWYLAARDEQADAFGKIFDYAKRDEQTDKSETNDPKDTGSRFSYAVRPTSQEFFDKLTASLPQSEKIQSTGFSPSDWIGDQSWFFSTWRRDPTIQSVLEALDAIHEKFSTLEGGYTRLTDEAQPPITFQVYAMDKAGLSDDLYIKMNARGLPLTRFEAFKARFEGMLKENTEQTWEGEPLADYVARQIDTRWCKLIWSKLPTEGKPKHYDHAFMNIFRLVAIIARELPKKTTDTEESKKIQEQWNRDTQLLVSSNEQIAFGDYDQRRWFEDAFTETLITIFNAWSSEQSHFVAHLPDKTYFDEEGFFQSFMKPWTGIEYEPALQFGGYLVYLCESCGEPDKEAFQEWMRLVRNLAANTPPGGPDGFRRHLDGIKSLAGHANDILSNLIELENFPTFTEQLPEERFKAALLLADPSWRALIKQAENHPYFEGQIGFLLNFSGIDHRKNQDVASVREWSAEQHLTHQKNFERYLNIAEQMFAEDGPNHAESCLWARVLLARGVNLLQHGSNLSFPEVAKTSVISWKRILRITDTWATAWREPLRQLWDALDTQQPLSEQLQKIIDDALSQPSSREAWVTALLRQPELLEHCRKHYLRRWDNQTYLLLKERMSAYHSELYSYSLFTKVDQQLKGLPPLQPPFKMEYIQTTSWDAPPHIRLTFPDSVSQNHLTIKHTGTQFVFSAPEAITGDWFEPELGFCQDPQDSSKWTISYDQAESALVNLVEKISIHFEAIHHD
jgi:hypothetical protein